MVCPLSTSAKSYTGQRMFWSKHMYVCLIIWSSVLGFRTHFAIISQTELLNIRSLHCY